MKRVRSDFYLDEEPFTPDLMVFEEPPETIDTGILDAGGTRIYRTPSRRKIGFELARRQR